MILAMAAERVLDRPPGLTGEGDVVSRSSVLLALLLAHLLQAGFRPQLQPAAAAQEEEEVAVGSSADDDGVTTADEQQQWQRQRQARVLRRTMRAHRPYPAGYPRGPGALPYLRSLQVEHQYGRRHRVAAHRAAPRRFLTRPTHPAVASARAAQVARTRAAARVVVKDVVEGARSLRGMLTGLLPAGWPRPAADHQYTAVLTLPPCADCSFRLVAAPAGWADVVLVNLSVLWGPGARAATSTSTYSLALPVGDYVVPQEDKSVAEEWPELRNVPVLAETVTSALSRPAICAARTAHAMVNPSLLGLPVRAAMRVLVHLPAADILRVSASCRTLHSLATDAGLWRYVLTRDFGPLRSASKLHVPDDDHPVDWRAEYRRLYRARSALKIRRSELSGSNYLATPRPSAALHDGGLGVQRQQQAYAQSCSSLGLIREDDVVAAPEDSPSAPRLQPTAPCLQSFYGGGVGRTPSSKSTVSRVSSNRSSHVGGLRRPAAPPPSKAKTSVAPVAAEEVVKVGSKVYKALLSYRAAAAPKPQQEKTAAPPAGEHSSAHKVLRGGRSQLGRHRQGLFADDGGHRFNSTDLDTSSVASSSRASSRSFCRVSSGARRTPAVVNQGAAVPRASSTGAAAARRAPPPAPQDHPLAADSHVPADGARPRSRSRPGPGLGATTPAANKRPAPSYLSLGDHRPYAVADDPVYARLTPAPGHHPRPRLPVNATPAVVATRPPAAPHRQGKAPTPGALVKTLQGKK